MPPIDIQFSNYEKFTGQYEFYFICLLDTSDKRKNRRPTVLDFMALLTARSPFY